MTCCLYPSPFCGHSDVYYVMKCLLIYMINSFRRRSTLVQLPGRLNRGTGPTYSYYGAFYTE